MAYNKLWILKHTTAAVRKDLMIDVDKAFFAAEAALKEAQKDGI